MGQGNIPLDEWDDTVHHCRYIGFEIRALAVWGLFTNWTRITSLGWWNENALLSQHLKFERWPFKAEHATSRSQRLPTILCLYEWAEKKHFVSLAPAIFDFPGRQLLPLCTIPGHPPMEYTALYNIYWTSAVFSNIALRWTSFSCLLSLKQYS